MLLVFSKMNVFKVLHLETRFFKNSNANFTAAVYVNQYS